MRFQSSQRSNKDTRRRLLAHPAAVPSLPEGPLLERLLPAEDVPHTRTPGGAGAAHGEDCAPYGLTGIFNSRSDLLCGT